MAVNYFIIIPHKNTPELLRKCLDSVSYYIARGLVALGGFVVSNYFYDVMC